MKRTVTALLLLPILAFGHWALDFDEDFAAASAGVSGNWWDGLMLESVWLMNEGIGSTVSDSVGTITGTGTALAWDIIGGVPCAAFNGTSTHIDFGNVYNIGVSNIFTYGGWFFFKSANDATTVFGKGSSALQLTGTYCISIGSSLSYVSSIISSGSAPTALGSIDGNVSNSWRFITASVEKLLDGTWRTTIGLNGVYSFGRSSGATTNMISNTDSLDIGKAGFPRYFTGYASQCFWGYGGTTTAERVYQATKSTYGY